LVCGIIIFYHEATAINVVLGFSNTIIGNIAEKAGIKLEPKITSVYLGLVNFATCGLSFLVVPLLWKKTNLVIGHLLIGLCHLGIVATIWGQA
jgi:hypothetical protein